MISIIISRKFHSGKLSGTSQSYLSAFYISVKGENCTLLPFPHFKPDAQYCVKMWRLTLIFIQQYLWCTKVIGPITE
jgi:hypothetical protein